MTYFGAWDEEIRSIEQAASRRRQQDFLMASTPIEVADRLSRSFGLYQAPNEIHLAYAESGIDPEDDAGIWAQTTAATQANRRSFQQGSIVNAEQLVNPPPTARFNHRGDLIGFEGADEGESSRMMKAIGMLTAGDPRRNGYITEHQFAQAVEQGIIAPFTLTKVLTDQKRDAMAQSSVGKVMAPDRLGDAIDTVKNLPGTSGTIAQVVGIARDNNLAGRAVEMAGVGAITATGAQSNLVGAQTSDADPSEQTQWIRRNILEPVGAFVQASGDAVAPAFNVGVVVLDTPYQMLQAEARQIYTRYKDDGLRGFAPREFSAGGVADFARDTFAQHLTAGMQTQVGAASFDLGEELRQGGEPQDWIEVAGRVVQPTSVGRENRVIGEGINVGSGYFFADEAEGFRTAIERQNTALINGQVATIGRWAASPLSVGSFEQSLVSGLIDASLAVAGPGDLAIDATFKSFRAARAFRTTEGGLPGLRVGDALIDASTFDEGVAALRATGVTTFTDEDVVRIVRATTDEKVAAALARVENPMLPGGRIRVKRGAGGMVEGAESSLKAPPRPPTTVDLNATLPSSFTESLHARWGAINGTRPTIDRNAVRHFLDSKRGQNLINMIADEGSVRFLDRVTRKSLSANRLVRYADATDAVEVRRLLDEDLGLYITRKPGRGFVPKQADVARNVTPRAARLSAMVPGGFWDLDDTRKLLDDTQSVLVNTGATPRTLDYWADRMVRAPRNQRFNVLTEMMEEIGLRSALKGAPDLEPKILEWAKKYDLDPDTLWDNIRANGINNNKPITGVEELDRELNALRTASGKVSTIFRDSSEMGRVYDLDYMTGRLLDTMVSDGVDPTVIDRAALHLHSEGIQRLVPIPDQREMRRYFSNLRPILLHDDGNLKISARVYDKALGIQSNFWKPAVLLRFAWPIRVVGEEQFRLAAGGYSSVARHPIHHISTMIANREYLGKVLDELGYKVGDPRRGITSYGTDLLEAQLKLADEHVTAMSQGTGRSFSRASSEGWDVMDTRNFFDAGRGDEVRRAWAEEMVKLSHDPVGRMLLDSEDLIEAKRIFWEEMSSVRDDIRVMRSDADAFDVTTRAGADAYVDTVASRIDRLATDASGRRSPVAMDAMRTKGLDGKPMADSRGSLNGEFLGKLKKYEDQVPAYLPYQKFKVDPKVHHGAVERLFTYLMAKPTDALSRSPVFRQEYWNEVMAIAPRIARADADSIIAAAKKAGIPKADVTQLRRTIGRDVTGDISADLVGTLSKNHVDTLAKAQALDRTQELLFDLSQRNQFFDVMSLVYPFGDAWAEVVTRWVKLTRDDPMILRRASQAVSTARETTFPGQDAPFVYETENGEDVFAYPLSGWLNEKAAGIGVPFIARTQGLSLATEILPGIGPVAQLPLAYALPDSTSWDKYREILFPFGEPELDHPAHTAWTQLVPPAWRRVFTAVSGMGATPEEERLFQSTFGNLFGGLGSSGDYDVFNQNPAIARDEIARLKDDAREATARMMFTRGVAQFGAPSAPAPEWFVEDPDGEKVRIETLRQLYGEIWESDSEDPIGDFLTEHGPWALAAVQGRTIARAPGRGLPATKEAELWARDNPSLGEDFSLVYGFFAPQEGEFDYNAYTRILDKGDRIPLSRDQQVNRWLHTMGQVAYSQERDTVVRVLEDAGWDGEGLMPVEARRWLSDFDDDLMERYGSETGGYGGVTGDWGGPQRASAEKARAQLKDAIEDPRLSNTMIAGASRVMFEVVDDLTDSWREAFPHEGANSWVESADGQQFRGWMMSKADELTAEVPDFAAVFETIFEPMIRKGLERDEQSTEGEG